MADFDCYVRVYLPLSASRAADTSNFGHYDLQIDGNNGVPLGFDSHTNLTSPVFSFGGIGGNGYVKIFSDSKTDIVFPFQKLLCKWHFKAPTKKVEDFITMMRNVLTFVSNSNPSYSLYKVNSAPFTVYNANRYNAFGATAAWCSGLGNGILMSIYNQYTNDSNGYMNYAAWEMFNANHPAWAFTSLN